MGVCCEVQRCYFVVKNVMHQKGINLNHNFYVVGKQCRTENAYMGNQHNIFM